MEKEYSVNGQIESSRVNLVLLCGDVEEAIPLSKALKIAEEDGLDVVEVSKKGKNGFPVCKVLDYGKMKYKKSKRCKGSKQIQKTKEIKYGYNIDQHDLKVKHDKILKFLSKKYTVRYTLELSGREKYMVDDAKETIDKNLLDFKDLATWNPPQISRGRRIMISTTLIPV
jgi:translation initiation factor IF-3